MAGILDYIATQMQTNPLVAAAVLGAPAALITYSVRELPHTMWNALKRTVSVELRFNSDMSDYLKVQQFVVDKLLYKNLSRSFNYHIDRREYPSDSKDNRSYVGVGYGNHIGRWSGGPLWIRRSLETSATTDRFKESLEIVFLGRGVNRVQRFLEQLEQYVRYESDEKKVTVYANDSNYWNHICTLTPRPLSSVITEDGVSEAALEHLQRFEQSRSWYISRGLPYHIGVLFVGVPGTGKTSLIQALAAAMNRNIFYLNLAALRSEAELMALIGKEKDWSKCMLVLEDLDVGGAAVDREDKDSIISLSTLLNILDGILSPEGLVVAATTNRPDKLDPALVRPGRFDITLELRELHEDGFVRMAQLFEVPQTVVERVLPRYKPTTGAQLRALMTGADYTALEAYYPPTVT